jgi:nitroreductase
MKEAIKQRKSVRSYDGVAITGAHEQLIKTYISEPENLKGLFGHTIRIYYNKTSGQKSEKIGTYGIIKNAPAYLITVCEKTKEALIDCGYVFEKLVLYLESIGLNTCWMGGTFNRDKIKVATTIGKDEMIPIISPVGYGAKKRSVIDKTFRKLGKSDHRKAFDGLFFEQDFKQRIEDPSVRALLEMVRIAPSASNQQPWRILMDQEGVAHFYLERTPDYGKGRLTYDIQMVDIGIALCHYELMTGPISYEIKDPGVEVLSSESSYILSVKA